MVTSTMMVVVSLMALAFMTFSLNWGFYLKMLLSVELMVVMFYLTLVCNLTDYMTMLFFITISIAGAIVGISLLMVSIRSFGTDKTTSFLF